MDVWTSWSYINLHEISQILKPLKHDNTPLNEHKMSLNWNLQNKQNKYNLDKQIEQINIHN